LERGIDEKQRQRTYFDKTAIAAVMGEQRRRKSEERLGSIAERLKAGGR
jgi:hypothetical protein